jgi:membrane-associated protein
MFHSLENAVSGSPWTYALIVGVCAADALLPLFPSETLVITAAVLASRGRLNIGLIAAAAAVGAMLGDNSAYWLGRSGLRRLSERLLGSEKNQRRLGWARTQIQQNGSWIIIVARFIPGGRTATTFIAGTLEMAWKRRFLPADTLAAVIWALFGSALGYFGGAAFETNLWLPVLIATGASLLVAGAGELVRRRFFAAGGDAVDRDHADREHAAHDHADREHAAQDHADREHAAHDHADRDHAAHDHAAHDDAAHDDDGATGGHDG